MGDSTCELLSKLISRRIMESKKEPPVKPKAKPGPKPQVLKINENWEDAVTRSFRKKKPPGGWPK